MGVMTPLSVRCITVVKGSFSLTAGVNFQFKHEWTIPATSPGPREAVQVKPLLWKRWGCIIGWRARLGGVGLVWREQAAMRRAWAPSVSCLGGELWWSQGRLLCLDSGHLGDKACYRLWFGGFSPCLWLHSDWDSGLLFCLSCKGFLSLAPIFPPFHQRLLKCVRTYCQLC